MSEFKSVRCDECGRIQDTANHWMKMAAHYSHMESQIPADAKPTLVAMGNVESDTLILGHSIGLHGMKETNVILDLCGQGCAMKHIAKLLGWSSVLEAGKD